MLAVFASAQYIAIALRADLDTPGLDTAFAQRRCKRVTLEAINGCFCGKMAARRAQVGLGHGRVAPLAELPIRGVVAPANRAFLRWDKPWLAVTPLACRVTASAAGHG